MNIEEIRNVYKEAECLADAEQVHAAFDNMADAITEKMQNANPLILSVMTGGLIPTAHLVTRLNFPLQIDYIHATRYQGKNKGGILNWIKQPSVDLQDRTILIVDDIFDEGITLSEIVNYCMKNGARQVYTAVLVNKLHQRKAELKVDFIGLEIEDRYLFGFGMDYSEYHRNANGIYAVKGM